MEILENRLKGFNVRGCYTSLYPTDKLGAGINPDLTLQEFYDVMERGDNCYEALGVYETTVRERVLGMISEILEVDYEVIWNMWYDNLKR